MRNVFQLQEIGTYDLSDFYIPDSSKKGSSIFVIHFQIYILKLNKLNLIS